jgi:DNA-binding SARP family transcriptional activator
MDEDKQRRELLIATPAFRIWLCGTFRVERYVDGHYEPIRTAEWGGSSYPRLLLKALLSCPGCCARREALIEMLWPELDFEQAVQNLNTAATKLRSVLRLVNGQESLLLAEDTSYALANRTLLWVDSDVSFELLKRVEYIGRSTPEAVPLLEEATSYFNRGVFLEGEEGLWALARRATLDRARYQCQLWLAEAYEQQDMPGQAESVLSFLLEYDPLDEDVLCRLMELLHRQRMTHQALRLYERSYEVFAKEGMNLTDATKELATHLSLREKRTQEVKSPHSYTSSHSNDFFLSSQSLLQGIIESMREWREAPKDLKLPPTEKDDMDKRRRELLHLLSQVGMTLALPIPDLDWGRIEGALIRPSRLDETVLHHLETINRSLWSMYLTAPIKSTIFESALGHFKTLIRFLKDSHPTTSHHSLCALTSEISQLVGEIFFDLNDYEAAESCYTIATLSAKEGQSYDLWSCALVRSAFLPIYSGRYEDALPLLQSAFKLSQRGDSSLPTRYWVAAVEAEAYSGVFDLAACQNALDQAQGVQDMKETILPWVRFSRARLPAQHGACYVRLRQPELAVPALQEALRAFVKPDRKRGMVLTDLTAAAAQLGEVEQARSYVDEIMTILTFGSSGFLRKGLRTLPQRLEPIAQPTSVKALDQYIGQQLQLPLA